MELNQLYYFINICKYGSFSATAKNLHITQQALSKSIASLESELELSLLYRSRSGVMPTKYGELLLKHSIKIYDEVNLLYLGLTQMRESIPVCCKIRISTSTGMASFIDLAIIKKFELEHLNINVSLSEHVNLECEKKVLNNSIDAAITIGPFDTTKFDIIPLTSYSMIAIVNSDNKLASNKEISLKELKGQQLTSISQKSYFNLVEKCKREKFEPNILFSTLDVMSIYDYCSKNNCVGFGAENKLRNITPAPSVRFIPLKDDILRIEICLITKRSNKKPDALKVFEEYIKKHVKHFIL